MNLDVELAKQYIDHIIDEINSLQEIRDSGYSTSVFKDESGFESYDYHIEIFGRWHGVMTLYINCDDCSKVEFSGSQHYWFDLSHPESHILIKTTILNEIKDRILHARSEMP